MHIRTICLTALLGLTLADRALATPRGSLVGSDDLGQHVQTRTRVEGNRIIQERRVVSRYRDRYEGSESVTRTETKSVRKLRYDPHPDPLHAPGVPAAGETVNGKRKTAVSLASRRDEALHGTWVTVTEQAFKQPAAKRVFVVGNTTMPNAFRSLFDTAGKILNFLDPTGAYAHMIEHGNKSVLDTPLPVDRCIVISEDGEFICWLPTNEVLSNKSLGLSSPDGMSHLGSNGQIAVEGDSYDVTRTIVVQLCSPIALDLDHDGKIAVTGHASGIQRFDPRLRFNPSGAVRFDLRGIGKEGSFEWLKGGGDGFLVDDRDGSVTAAALADGRITGLQLFGGHEDANGYTKLARCFEKAVQVASGVPPRLVPGFGHLTGDELDGLKIWRDANHDARVQFEELATPAELGITEIGCDYELVTRKDDLALVSTFTQNGKTYMSEDVWFAEGPEPRPARKRKAR